MEKLILIGICLLLLSGCQKDMTPMICETFKEMETNKNISVNYNNGLCVVAIENATSSYIFSCNSITRSASILFKTDKDNLTKKEMLDTFKTKLFCDFYKVGGN